MTSSTALGYVREWIANAMPTATVIYAKQAVADAPRPALPYVTLDWTTDVALSATPYEETTDTEVDPGDPESLFVAKVDQVRRGTVNVVYYGDDAIDALAVLRLSLRTPTARVKTRDRGISVIPASSIVDTTNLRSTKWEPAASMDYHVTYLAETTHDGGVIETVVYDITHPDPS